MKKNSFSAYLKTLDVTDYKPRGNDEVILGKFRKNRMKRKFMSENESCDDVYDKLSRIH